MRTRPMTRDEAKIEMTMWATPDMWCPFVEDEDGNITGPGHQDPSAFAAAVTMYDVDVCGNTFADATSSYDVTHMWCVVPVDDDGEWVAGAVSEGTPGAIPVTTVWGVR